MQGLGPVHIEKRLINGNWLNQWRQLHHHLTNFTANADIVRHAWLDHHGLGAFL